MVFAQSADFAARIIQFAASLANCRAWLAALRKFLAAFADEPGWYCKLDHNHGQFEQLSIYARFPAPMTQQSWQRFVTAISPCNVGDIDPFAIAEKLGTTGPIGVAFAVSDDSTANAAVYFAVPVQKALQQNCFGGLAQSVSWTAAIIDEMHNDMQPALTVGTGDVIVAFSATDARSLRIKIDIPKVPVDRACALLRAKGVETERISDIYTISRRLRLTTLNYAGLSYNANGWLSWKVYFAKTPLAVTSVNKFTC